jgi:hypothetical protein
MPGLPELEVSQQEQRRREKQDNPIRSTRLNPRCLYNQKINDTIKTPKARVQIQTHFFSSSLEQVQTQLGNN